MPEKNTAREKTSPPPRPFSQKKKKERPRPAPFLHPPSVTHHHVKTNTFLHTPPPIPLTRELPVSILLECGAEIFANKTPCHGSHKWILAVSFRNRRGAFLHLPAAICSSVGEHL